MSLLTSVLGQPERLESLDESEWDGLLRLARYAMLLGTLHEWVEERGMRDEIPEAAGEVLCGAFRYIQYMQLLAKRELGDLAVVLAGAGFPVVLLKGAAYLAAGLPPSRGRRLNDIDILVQHEQLPKVERLLNEAGWKCDEDLTAYDQRYYREWSHELPPMHHPDSPMELDVHYNLIQPTSRIKLDSGRLFDGLVPVEGAVFSTLSPPDMVLHSATHLFMSDELRGGLRDLVDMHLLCAHFSAQDSDYWAKLAARAQVLGLQRPLYYAAATMRRNLHTAIPDEAWRDIAAYEPNWLVRRVMRHAIDRHIAPDDIAHMHSRHAERLLYLRSHWIRMPPLMLARHLAYKWWAGLQAADPD